MDMLDITWEPRLRDTFALLQACMRTHQPLPRQTHESLAHLLDRAVINFAVSRLLDQGTPIRTVRAAFRRRPDLPRLASLQPLARAGRVRNPALIVRSWRARRQ